MREGGDTGDHVESRDPRLSSAESMVAVRCHPPRVGAMLEEREIKVPAGMDFVLSDFGGVLEGIRAVDRRVMLPDGGVVAEATGTYLPLSDDLREQMVAAWPGFEEFLE
jgi:hypothetical protein